MHVFSIKQAQRILNTLRTIEETNAMHLRETIDKDAFKDAKIPHINIISYDDMWMLDNKDTYPLKDLFKELGFRFERIDGIQACWRAKQSEVKTEDIKHIIETWGWTHKIYTETVDTDDA